MLIMAKDDINDLPPEERIKKLKKIESEKKKEIAEAQKQLKDSNDELTERKKWTDKVPIPEFAQENLEGLSVDGGDILKAKGLISKKSEDEEITSKKELDLEETVAQEQITLPAESANIEYGPPGQEAMFGGYKPISEKPMGDLYSEAIALKDSIADKGYISKEDEKRAQYLSGVAEERLQGSSYSFTEDTAKAASLTKMIGASIRNDYKSHSGSGGGNPNYQ
jgi:hypothetical protein